MEIYGNAQQSRHLMSIINIHACHVQTALQYGMKKEDKPNDMWMYTLRLQQHCRVAQWAEAAAGGEQFLAPDRVTGSSTGTLVAICHDRAMTFLFTATISKNNMFVLMKM